MAISRFSDDVVPHLSERDARQITEKVVERLRALGGQPRQIGISLDREGFWFTGVVNGRSVTARTGQGHFTYEQVAKDLLLASTDPGWNRLTVQPA